MGDETIDIKIKYLEEKFSDLKQDIRSSHQSINQKLENIERGYVRHDDLESFMKSYEKRISNLENRNIRIDRLVGGAIILALLGLVVVEGGFPS